MYAISAYTDHPQEAAKLLNFLINSPEMASLQMSEKGVPVSKTARQTLHDMPDSDISYEFMASEYMNENIDKLSIIQPVMENDEIISAFKECGDDYIYNKKTLAECSQSLYKTIAEKCNE